MKRTILTAIALFFAIFQLNQSTARVRGIRVDASIYNNACGSVSATQTWCVASDGWTKFSGSPVASGTCGASGNAGGTCVVLVASVANGGNNATCSAGLLPTGITSDNWSTLTGSSFSPAITPCSSLDVAQGKLRTADAADWMLLHRGDSWDGGFGGTTSGGWSHSGISADKPMVIGTYGTGAQPRVVRRNTSHDISIFDASNTSARNLAIVDIELYDATSDPNSSDALQSILTGDTGVANCGSNTVICNVTVPTWIQNSYNISGGYAVYGSGLNNVSFTWSAGAPNTLTLSGGTAGFTATGLTFQAYAKGLAKAGISINSNHNFLIIEGINFNYSYLSLVQNANQPLPVVQFNIRRNTFKTPWIDQGIFLSGVTTAPTGNEYILLEENVINEASSDSNPLNWAGSTSSLNHCLYSHDPSVAHTIRRNVFSNCASSALQQREGSTFYNNLMIANIDIGSFQVSNYSHNLSYNVFDHATDTRYGFRTATAVATSGTVLSFNGQTGRAGSLLGVNVINLSNPGSLPQIGVNGATATVVTSTAANAASVNLDFTGTGFAGIQAGVRGDGVQVGDLLQFTSTGGGLKGPQFEAGSNQYVDAGPNGVRYPVGTTVTISNGGGSAAVVTDTVGRGTDEIFKFTSGSPPAGTSLNTDYCSTNVNNTSKTYNYYPATAGTCPGVASNQVTSSASGSAARQGSRKFTFANGYKINDVPVPVPSRVNVGDLLCVVVRNQQGNQDQFGGANGCTTVSYISSDRLTIFTADPVVTTFDGGVTTFIYGLPDPTGLYPGFRYGPNNFMGNSISARGAGGAALYLQNYTNYVNASGNYFYNQRVDSSAIIDTTSITSPFSATNTTSGQVLNTYQNGSGASDYPWANTDAYDASLNTPFSGTLASNGNGGSTLTAAAGSVSVGDILFAADGSNTITQGMKVVSQTDATHWVTNKAQNVGPISMISGSYTHFINMALANRKGSWDSRYTVRAANNFIRTKLKCGDQVTYPGSAACPPQ